MNNQRRHDLERNVLADKMGESFEKVQPLYKPILLVVVVGLVGFFGYQLIKGQSSKAEAKNWTEFYFNRTSGDAESYAAMGEEFGNTPSGQWAHHSAAQGYLRDGIESIYINRKEGVENIRKAISEWDKVDDSSIAELRFAAKLGLAQAHETLGELDEAVKAYQVVVEMSGSADDQKKRLNEQIAYLKSPEAKSFYEWFNKLDPKPAAPPTFSGDLGLPPMNPSITLDPTKLPAFNTPSANPAPTNSPAPTNPPAGTTPPATPPSADIPPTTPPATTTPVTPATETPATPTQGTPTPAGSTPTTPTPAETPASPAPAPTETPATPETPATETPTAPTEPK